MSNFTAALRRGLACLALAALVVGGAGGCASTGPERTDVAVTSLRSLRDEISLGRGKVLGVSSALDRILKSRPDEVRSNFEAYCLALVDLESAAESVRDRVQSMESKAAEYQKVWDDEIKAIGDKDLRTIAETRKARVTKAFGDIKSALGQSRTFAATFRQKTGDLRTYLGNDCTQAAVQAATAKFQEAIASAVVLIAPIDNSLVTINRLVAVVEVKMQGQSQPASAAAPQAPAQPAAPPKTPPSK